MSNTNKYKSDVILDLSIDDDGFGFATSIDDALVQAEAELVVLNETVESIKELKPQCDKLDYILAASSGALCGIIDIFLVGKPGESPLGDITDKWFANRTMDFAKLCHPDKKEFNSLDSALRFLEKEFRVPYDQTGLGDAGRAVFDMNAKNHHFKALAHNPSLLGLFFRYWISFLTHPILYRTDSLFHCSKQMINGRYRVVTSQANYSVVL